jgi:hypothetical protein
LKTLDLSNIEFSVDDMSSSDNVRIASQTFYGADLSELMTLNMEGTKFASINMITTNQGKIVYSGYETFSLAILSNLTNLNLSDSIFAVDNAMTPNGCLCRSAASTFEDAHLSKLSILNLSKTILETKNMDTDSTFHFPASNTFFTNDFPSLTEIYLPTTTQSSYS